MALSRKRGLSIAAAILLLAIGLIYLVTQPGSNASAEAEEPMVPGFAAIEPVTPEVVAGFSDEVEFRLMTQRFRIGHAEKPEPIDGFATIDLPSGRTAHLSVRGQEFCGWIEYDGGTCSSLEQARTGTMYSSGAAGSCGAEVTGFVPDDVAYVLVDEKKDGTIDQRWPATTNVYRGIVKGKEDATLTGYDAEGDRFFKVELPLGFFMMDSACPADR